MTVQITPTIRPALVLTNAGYARGEAQNPVTFLTTDGTLDEIDELAVRDGVSRAGFFARAVEAYRLMYPGPDYVPKSL